MQHMTSVLIWRWIWFNVQVSNSHMNIAKKGLKILKTLRGFKCQTCLIHGTVLAVHVCHVYILCLPFDLSLKEKFSVRDLPSPPHYLLQSTFLHANIGSRHKQNNDTTHELVSAHPTSWHCSHSSRLQTANIIVWRLKTHMAIFYKRFWAAWLRALSA